jgi:hypothetical protein
MADQHRNDSNPNRGQKPSPPQYSDEPQQPHGDKRQQTRDEEPTSTSGAERGRGSMADDRARKERQNLGREKHDPRDRDRAIESDLDDDDDRDDQMDQMDDESDDEGPAR